MQEPSFTTSQVADLTGLTVRQLNHWSQTGMFLPGVQQAHGSGTRKLYSVDDVVQLKSLAQLKCARWSTQRLRGALDLLRKVMQDANPLSKVILVPDKHTLFGICKTKQGEQLLLDTLHGSGQQVLGIVLETLEAETQQAIKQFSEQDAL